ncbi:MAG: short-chain dehydrogenase [Halobacteriovoraceae bacterium]|nr:short-chain dehydrogenase [Halobacteriovoraceae bacterium]
MESKSLHFYKGGVSLITGGASGIGLAFGKELAKRGCHVILADLQKEVAEKEAKLIEAEGGKASSAFLDVRDSQAFEKLILEMKETHGRIDTLFNNAGVVSGWEVKDDPIEDWNYIVDVNIKGVMNGTLACYKVMVEQGFGHIINTASVAGILPAPFVVSYGMTKHAVVGLSVSLKAQAARYGVRVSALCPGFIETPILEGGKYGRVESKIVEKLKERPLPLMTLTPQALVKKVLPQIEKNKCLIVEPIQMKILWWLYRLSPSFVLWLVARLWRLINKKMNLKSEP